MASSVLLPANSKIVSAPSIPARFFDEAWLSEATDTEIATDLQPYIFNEYELKLTTGSRSRTSTRDLGNVELILARSRSLHEYLPAESSITIPTSWWRAPEADSRPGTAPHKACLGARVAAHWDLDCWLDMGRKAWDAYGELSHSCAHGHRIRRWYQ